MKQNIQGAEGTVNIINDAEKINLITSPSISTIENMKRGDEVSLKVGRKGYQSYVSSINFVIRQLM